MNEELLNIVKNCQHINMYDKEHPICQRGCLCGTYYECKGE